MAGRRGVTYGALLDDGSDAEDVAETEIIEFCRPLDALLLLTAVEPLKLLTHLDGCTRPLEDRDAVDSWLQYDLQAGTAR